MAAIGVFDMFNMEEFEPEEADPDLFRRRRSGSIEVRMVRHTGIPQNIVLHWRDIKLVAHRCIDPLFGRGEEPWLRHKVEVVPRT